MPRIYYLSYGSKQCSICGQQEMKGAIEGLLDFASHRCELDEERYFYLRLVLNELILNALEHGSPDWAAVTVRVENHELAIEVRDRGPGFDPAAVQPCDDVRDCGRGLFLVKNVCSRVECLPGCGCITAYLGL